MPRITADLYRAVVESDIGVRHAVVLVHPIRVQSKIGREHVFIPLQLFSTFNIEIPTVEHGIQPLGFGQILQRMIADKYLFDIFQFICEHIERDRTALLTNESVDVYRTVSEIPVIAEAAQVI